jgi:RimJ/RimL family protein N-acetyltransferase
MVILTTERLLLRHFHLMDREALLHVFGDAEVMRFGDGIHTKEWVEEWLHTCLVHYYETWGFGPYAVVLQSSEEVIGYCGLFYFPDVNGKPEVEIGYRLRRSTWGKGYATEAARAIRDYAFHTLSIRRLIALIDTANTESLRVAEKIGMQYEGKVMFEGYTHPDHVYVVDKCRFERGV